MFMHRNAQCQACDRVFCCSTHCTDHRRKCVVLNSKHGLSKSKMAWENQKMSVNQTIPSASVPQENVKPRRLETPQMSRKRKHASSIILHRYNELNSLLINGTDDRKKLIAVRNKYKKVPMSTQLQTIMEEKEDFEIVPDELPQTSIVSSVEAYKAFKTGSLKDSPIITIPNNLMLKSTGILPKLEGGIVKTDLLTSTPNDTSIKKEEYTINQLGPRVEMSNICCSTPKETIEVFPLPVSIENATKPIENINIAKVTALVSPILTDVTPCQTSMSKRKMPDSPWESENAIYYTAKSFLSPQNPVPDTPLQNPSLFTSVKDAFRNLVCRLPGVAKTNDESLKICPSPPKKRSKVIELSPIMCRPTLRGRYQDN